MPGKAGAISSQQAMTGVELTDNECSNSNTPVVSPLVRDALASGRAVVALESTIIAHGMPYPRNLATALALEDAVAKHGATPATIAILGGRMHVGLSRPQLEVLARHNVHAPGNERVNESKRPGVRKVARRDISSCVIDNADGATTVSATMAIAAMVGIRVFATGGIGGVHRGVADSWDVSADILALADTPVLVVCAGVKTILDVPKTLEALETASVPVISLRNDNDRFPGFYTRNTSVRSPKVVSDERTLAKLFSTHSTLSRSGILVAVPIPEHLEANKDAVEIASRQALREAREKKIVGSRETPYVLARVAELTKNESLDANVQLVLNNATVAARVAVHLERFQPRRAEVLSRPSAPRGISCKDSVARTTYDGRPVVVIVGGTAIDITSIPQPGQGDHATRGTSTPGKTFQAPGGVGRNIAHAACNAGAEVDFYSAVGDDLLGRTVVDQLRSLGVRTEGIAVVSSARTATSSRIQTREGDLDVGIADMAIFDTSLPVLHDKALRARFERALEQAGILGLDGNLSTHDMGELASLASRHHIPVWFEPVSVAKSVRVLEREDLFNSITHISPNEDELLAIGKLCRSDKDQPNGMHGKQDIQYEDRAAAQLENAARHVLLRHRGPSLCIVCTRGPQGVTLYRQESTGLAPRSASQPLQICTIPATPVPGGHVVSTTGAGDVLAGTMMAWIAQNGPGSEVSAARRAVVAAAEACRVKEAVPDRRAKL